MASATYDPANEQTSFAGQLLEYDANGNLWKEKDGAGTVLREYQWDARNRLTGITGNATATFKYDVLGRRVQKTLSTQSSVFSTGFLYDGNDIAAEIGGGAIGANYLRSLIIDEPFIRQASIGNEHYHTDALGSALALSNAQGVSGATYSYEPFGKTTVTGTSVNALQFTGRENDGNGLYYYRARYYSPRLSRFIREDPIGLPGGFNFYSYVLNNAPNNIDPLGLCVIGFGAQNGIMIAATNDGNQSIGPFVAANSTYPWPISNGPIPNGTYPIGQTRRQGFNGTPTSDGLRPFDRNRNRQQALGDAFIPIDPVPGRTGIGIHARFPDTPDLKPTLGCIRVHNNDVNELASFLESKCQNETNTFIKY